MIKKLRYDKEGLGASELMWLALYHPIFFIIAKYLIDHDIKIMALLRKII